MILWCIMPINIMKVYDEINGLNIYTHITLKQTWVVKLKITSRKNLKQIVVS